MCNFGLSECNKVNPIALKMIKTLWSFGHSLYNRIKGSKNFSNASKKNRSGETNMKKGSNFFAKYLLF